MCLDLRDTKYNSICEVESLINFYNWTPEETKNNGFNRSNIEFKIKAMQLIREAEQ